MRSSVVICALLIGCGGAASSTDPRLDHGERGPATADEAREFVARVDADLRRLYVAQSQAEWAKQTNITPEHEAAAAKAGAELMTYVTSAIRESRRYDSIRDQLDADTRRLIHLLRISGQPAPDDPAQARELASLVTRMDGAYGSAKACDAAGRCRDLLELEDVLAKQRDPEELLAAWQGWHDAAGAAIAPMYSRFVELANVGAKGVGFADVGAMWRSGYDMSPAGFEQEVDRLWSQLAPLYRDLHCYARRKLVDTYGATVVPMDGPIPAHLLGNMWAQHWGYLFPELEPHKGVAPLDVTPARMAKLAEGFFVSLGLDPLPPTFWERSMLTKPEGREVVCHASAWDVTYADDLRIKMCTRINQEDLVVLHHELGHNYYYHYYYTRPILFQSSANDGFHEAVGDTIALSMTPDYLVQVGLLGKAVDSPKATINRQMMVALDKIAFLPFALSVDKWRWDVFAGRVAPADYNRHWWELRREYQGIAPTVSRDGAFDPGAKYHIPGNTPYMRYFLATVLQFQFHRALCAKAGHTGALHDCSIYGSKPAGEALRAMLALGASRPWPEALEALTGERRMDGGAMMEYFAPLREWLAKENQGKRCGW
jgi:peptidyl-dipeptidase A